MLAPRPATRCAQPLADYFENIEFLGHPEQSKRLATVPQLIIEKTWEIGRAHPRGMTPSTVSSVIRALLQQVLQRISRNPG
jgi:hypothetical protein